MKINDCLLAKNENKRLFTSERRMKIGDLVKCRNDENAIWGIGLVIAEETRMVKVLWNEQISKEEAEETDDGWLWKTNLEVLSENRGSDSK